MSSARDPAVAGGRRHRADIGAEDVQFEREMREDMADLRRLLASSAAKGAPATVASPSTPRRPAGRRHLASCRRAGPCRAACAAASRRRSRTATKAAPRRSGLSAFGALHRQQLGIARDAAPGSRRAAGRACSAAASACRSSRRDPSSPGRNRRAASGGTSVSTSARISGLAAGQRRRGSRTAAP